MNCQKQRSEAMRGESGDKYNSLQVLLTSSSSVAYLYLNRPSARNALSPDFFSDFPKALASLDQNSDVNVIVLAASGNHFCAGIDLNFLTTLMQTLPSDDRGRFAEAFRRQIKDLQDAITAIERCRKPVIAAIQGACIGGGVDIVTACDIRFCTKDAFFSVKEVDLGITADLGTLQRLPSIVGYGNAIEVALTGRSFSGSEAKELGLVSRVFNSKNEMDEGVRIISDAIASKSPLAVTGTKAVLLKVRDMSLDQGLDYVATWNSAMLISNDLKEAVMAQAEKRKPVFSKL